MKKFLSLVLALVMTMSLVTVSAGAKEFTDDDAITYGEAIEVISTIGVVDGYADGKFNPTNNLTRQAAAKIICNLVLGPTTAASLVADTAPFPDVPVNGDFAGYITYCAQKGIINGYPDGTFKPGNPLTGFAFMKMLLGALGYKAEIEGYVCDNWSVAVAKQAVGIGLTTGLEGEFNGTKTVNREEACLYALNMIQADLVEYTTIINGSVNGDGYIFNPGAARSRQWPSSASRVNNIKDDNIIQFAEEYFNKLEKRATTDDFGRPSHTWVYDKQELGSYIDYDKLMTEYTKKVTGKDLFDLIGSSRRDECALEVYIDGVDTSEAPLFGKDEIVRANDEKVGETDKGVLTQVFLDTDRGEHGVITIAIINTYLAKAQGDYNEKDEDVDFTVFGIDNKRTPSAPVYVKDTDVYDDTTMTAEVEDFGMVEDVKEDDIYLVTVAQGKIQTIEDPETLADVTINGFKKGKWIKTGGTQYDYADTALYDEEALEAYDRVNLKDVTYNVFLDPYGYLIGLEQNEDPDEYVFLTGIDTSDSNIHKGTASGNVIFLDGTMKTVTIDLEESSSRQGGKGHLDLAGGRNKSQLNTWCKYRVSNDNVYTLTEVVTATGTSNPTSDSVKAAQYSQNVASYNDGFKGSLALKEINKKHVSLNAANATSPTASAPRVYGNDKTVYLNLELANIRVKDDRLGGDRRIVDDVESVTVGVKDVDLTVYDLQNVTENGTTFEAPLYDVHTLYDNKGYIIAVATLDAENNGSAANYVYVTSDKPSYEEYGTAGNNAGGKKGEETWTWAREVLINGEIKDIYEIGDHLKYIGNADDQGDMQQGEWYEVKMDADGFVRKATPVPFSTTGKYVNAVKFVEAAINGTSDTVLVHDKLNVNKVVFENGTLYTDQEDTYGFHVADSVVTVLALAGKKGDGAGKDEFDSVELYNGTSGLKQAIRNMNVADTKDFNNATVEISAILVDGSATAIVINDMNAPGTKGTNNGSSNKIPVPTTKNMGVSVSGNTITANVVWDSTTIRQDIEAAMWAAGYMPWQVNVSAGTAIGIRTNSKVGVANSDWVYFKLVLNYFAQVEVEGSDDIFVPCDATGKWDEKDYNVSELVATKNGNYVAVDGDGIRFYVYDNDTFEKLNWMDENGKNLMGNATIVPNLIKVTYEDSDTADYYGTTFEISGLTYNTDDDAVDNDYVQNGESITVSWVLGTGDSATARYKITMIENGKESSSSNYLPVKDGKVTATFKAGKKDITGFKVVREDVVTTETVAVKVGEITNNMTEQANKVYGRIGISDFAVEKGKNTEVSFTITVTEKLKKAVEIAINIDSLDPDVVSFSVVDGTLKVIEENEVLTNRVVLDEGAEGQYTIKYSVKNITASENIVNFTLSDFAETVAG